MRIREGYDAVVAGGGPAGCVAAWKLAEGGASVLLVERDSDIGCPVRCAEGMVVDELRNVLPLDPAYCGPRCPRSVLVSPDGTRAEMADGAEIVVLERKIFDRVLAERAATAGARIVTHTEAIAAERTDGSVVVTLEDGATVKARVVVAADGIESRVARWLGSDTAVEQTRMATCAQYLVAGLDIDETTLEFHAGGMGTGGYFWVFPKGNGAANVGLCAAANRANPFDSLDAAVDKRFPGVSIVGRTQGGVDITGGAASIVLDNLVLVGDAARHADPITGGGIGLAMKGAEMASRAVLAALEVGDVSRAALETYEKEFDAAYGGRLRLSAAARDVMFARTDAEWNVFVRKLAELPDEKRTYARAARRLLTKHPRLLVQAAKLFLIG